MADTKVYKLQSSDDKVVEVTDSFIQRSVTLNNMLQDMPYDPDEPIPVPNVPSNILTKVKEYCDHHKDDPIPDEEETTSQQNDKTDLEGFDAEFVRDIDQGTLFQLILAANFLDIKNLLDLTCTQAANMIRNKTTEEIRHTFNIKNDFTREEEEQVRKENEWCEDD